MLLISLSKRSLGKPEVMMKMLKDTLIKTSSITRELKEMPSSFI